MKNYSTSDKIAVLAAWVLVHVVFGIATKYAYGMCGDIATSTGVFILSCVLHYKWAYKMAGEVDEIFKLS